MGWLLAGCAGVSGPIQSLTDSDHQYGSSEQEQRLIAQADAAHQELLGRGLLYRQNTVNDYISRVGHSVTPAIVGDAVKIHFYVLKDPAVNAMAFPNGNVYINVGLLARLENEAQLAHVLSHEVAHVVQRHSLKGSYSRQNTIVAAHITDLLMFGTSIAYLPFIHGLSVYSQEQELEADKYALEYMRGANYDVRQSQEVFRVIQETKAVESVPGSIYASHPTHQQRIDKAKEWIATLYSTQGSQGFVGVETYQSVRQQVTRLNLQLKLNEKQFQLTIEAVDKALQHAMNDPWLWYYKGEAYRLMAEQPKSAAREYIWLNGKQPGDAEEVLQQFTASKGENLQQAAQIFRDALSRAGELPQLHRGLGLVAFVEGDNSSAVQELHRYLEGEPQAKDKLYIEHILQDLGGNNEH